MHLLLLLMVCFLSNSLQSNSHHVCLQVIPRESSKSFLTKGTIMVLTVYILNVSFFYYYLFFGCTFSVFGLFLCIPQALIQGAFRYITDKLDDGYTHLSEWNVNIFSNTTLHQMFFLSFPNLWGKLHMDLFCSLMF